MSLLRRGARADWARAVEDLGRDWAAARARVGRLVIFRGRRGLARVCGRRPLSSCNSSAISRARAFISRAEPRSIHSARRPAPEFHPSQAKMHPQPAPLRALCTLPRQPTWALPNPTEKTPAGQVRFLLSAARQTTQPQKNLPHPCTLVQTPPPHPHPQPPS